MIIAGLSDPLFASKLDKMDRNANQSNLSQKQMMYANPSVCSQK